ncbi:MAG TPA: RHS repeat-associated core domain-containing protein, partial [Paludibacteraceae bacterium]|nr:RHS repeat-associated core domain-containing protein [Paludibacteraceae bacterium]
LDDITGLYDHGARSRDPKLTMWYGVDPLFEKYPDFSPYNYCMGNPVRFVDPDGRGVYGHRNEDGSMSYVLVDSESETYTNENGTYIRVSDGFDIPKKTPEIFHKNSNVTQTSERQSETTSNQSKHKSSFSIKGDVSIGVQFGGGVNYGLAGASAEANVCSVSLVKGEVKQTGSDTGPITGSVESGIKSDGVIIQQGANASASLQGVFDATVGVSQSFRGKYNGGYSDLQSDLECKVDGYKLEISFKCIIGIQFEINFDY